MLEALRGTTHVLIADVRGNSEAQIAALISKVSDWRKAYAEFAETVRVIAIGDEAITPPPGVVVAVDSNNEFTKTYRTGEAAAFLVRPDGYIGWRGSRWTDTGLEEYLRTMFVAARTV